MLYVVATPLGNFDDFSPRAADVLRNAELILCEDTRTSFPLLKAFEIETRLRSYHKFNEREGIAPILELLRSGSDVALITDAGTPGVSDPGAKLVEAAALEGIDVSPIPGACAAIAALSVSGFNAVSFVFRGFLPRKKGQLARVLLATLSEPSPVSVFYESPLRITATMALMVEHIPDSRVCLCNDLTKPHERVYRGSPADVLALLYANPKSAKGEYTIVLARANVKPAPAEPYNVAEPFDDD